MKRAPFSGYKRNLKPFNSNIQIEIQNQITQIKKILIYIQEHKFSSEFINSNSNLNLNLHLHLRIQIKKFEFKFNPDSRIQIEKFELEFT